MMHTEPYSKTEWRHLKITTAIFFAVMLLCVLGALFFRSNEVIAVSSMAIFIFLGIPVMSDTLTLLSESLVEDE